MSSHLKRRRRLVSTEMFETKMKRLQVDDFLPMRIFVGNRVVCQKSQKMMLGLETTPLQVVVGSVNVLQLSWRRPTRPLPATSSPIGPLVAQFYHDLTPPLDLMAHCSYVGE